MDGGAWQAAVHGVTKSRTWLSDFTFTFHFHALEKEMATHSRVLAWWIPGTAEPGGLPSMELHRVGHDWSDLALASIEMEHRNGLGEWNKKADIAELFSTFSREGNCNFIFTISKYFLMIKDILLLSKNSRETQDFKFHLWDIYIWPWWNIRYGNYTPIANYETTKYMKLLLLSGRRKMWKVSFMLTHITIKSTLWSKVQKVTGLEKVSFHSSPKERQRQRMFKLPNSCIHLTR